MGSERCEFCWAGTAGPYLRNRAAGRKINDRGDVSCHEEGCPRYFHVEGKPDETVVYCQGCGLGRTGYWLHLLAAGAHLGLDRYAHGGGYRLRCPRCAEVTRHHPGPPEVVAAEECVCGGCRMRRCFAELLQAAPERRAAA